MSLCKVSAYVYSNKSTGSVPSLCPLDKYLKCPICLVIFQGYHVHAAPWTTRLISLKLGTDGHVATCSSPYLIVVWPFIRLTYKLIFSCVTTCSSHSPVSHQSCDHLPLLLVPSTPLLILSYFLIRMGSKYDFAFIYRWTSSPLKAICT